MVAGLQAATGCYSVTDNMANRFERATFQKCEGTGVPREAWQPPGAMATAVLQTGQGWDSSTACRSRPAADHSGEEDALDVDKMFGSPALLRARAARPPTTRACVAQEELGSTAQAQLKWLGENTDALPRDTAGTLPVHSRVSAPSVPVHNSEKESGVTASHHLPPDERGNVRGSEKEDAVTAVLSISPSVITAVSPGAERDRNGPAPARQLMWDPAWSKASPEPVQEGRVKSRTPVDLGIEVVHQRLEAATGTQQAVVAPPRPPQALHDQPLQ